METAARTEQTRSPFDGGTFLARTHRPEGVRDNLATLVVPHTQDRRLFADAIGSVIMRVAKAMVA